MIPLSFPEEPDMSDFIPIHLRQSILETAAAFAAEQRTPAKAHQVYLNTLSVSAVNEYLTFLDIATDIQQSDGWHCAMRAANNTADLPLPEIGTIECLPISPKETVVSIPPEAQIRRLAYLVVEVAAPFKVAHILGFVQSPVDGQGCLAIEQLQPLDNLPGYLLRFHHSHIGQWFQDQFSDVWQLPNTVLAVRQPAFRLSTQPRPLRQRARIVELGQNTDTPMKLGLHLTVRSHDDACQALVRIYPAISDNSGAPLTLPPGLALERLSDEGEVLETQIARSVTLDEFAQLKPFEALTDDQFQIRVRYHDAETIEILSF